MAEDYTADSIEPLDGVESIRRRPVMYVGRLDSPDLTTRLLLQALCHAFDCAVDEYCTEITIEVAERSARVRYDAALPLALTPQGIIAAELLLTIPAACSSMKKNLRVGDKYCSLGMAVLTAVTKEMLVEIVERERSCTIELACGRPVRPSSIVPNPATSAESTRLSFTLDDDILPGNTKFDLERIRAACDEAQTDFPGLRIEVRALEVAGTDRDPSAK